MARKNEIVDSIIDRLKSSGMTPQDIVSISGGRIPITQAYDWFRDWKLSVIAALLLECYMEKHPGSAGISYPVKTSEEKVEEFVGKKVEKMLITTVEEISEPKKVKSMKSPTVRFTEEKPKSKPINVEWEMTVVKQVDSDDKVEVLPESVKFDLSETGVILDQAPAYPIAERKGFSFGADKTMKIVAGIVKLNYNGSYYSILMKDAKNGFIVEGEKLTLADFKEVK